jgi:hypothetical protein
MWQKLKDMITLAYLRKLTVKMGSDVFTNWNGDFDPARLCYAFILADAIIFNWLSIYDTYLHKSFNSMAYSGGCVAIGAQIIAAAAGVRLKQNSEQPFPRNDFPGHGDGQGGGQPGC